MRGLLVLLGESFRGGGQHCRLIGEAQSFDGQISALKSQMTLINYLEKKHTCSINVYIGTYTTKYNNDLIDMFKEHLINSDFYESRIGFNNLLHKSIKKIGNLKLYDFVLVLRIDLFLKNHFISIFDPKWQTIRFPTILWETLPCGNPKINDMMIFIPSKYYNYIEKINFRSAPRVTCASNGHFIWSDLVKTTDLTSSDLDAMIDTFHDSDSKKEFNPIYYIVNREINTIHKHPGYRFDKSTHMQRRQPIKSVNVQPIQPTKSIPSIPSKCKTEMCFYRNNTNKLNNGGLYCCKSCRDKIGHGLLCEKIKY